MVKPPTMGQYIASAPPRARPILKKIREGVYTVVPEAVPVMSYGMPAFKWKGKILVYFAAWKEHIGLYPPVPAALKKEVANYAGPKGNLQFPLNKPIPYGLIKKIVKYRAQHR